MTLVQKNSPILKQYSDICYKGDYLSFLNEIREIELSAVIDKSKLNIQHETIELESFDETKQTGSYNIVVEEVNFNCFYSNVTDQYMYVFLSGAAVGHSIYQRWSWNPHGITLAIADPMTTSHGLSLGWYYGSKKKDYRELCAKLIKHIAATLKLDNSKIILYGSSGGATSALHISSYIPGCVTVAINPQIDIHSLQNSVDKLEHVMDLKIDDNNLRYRNDLNNLLNNSTNKYILLINCLSKEDFVPAAELVQKFNHTVRFGISHNNNLCTWVFKAKAQIASSGDWSTHNSQDFLILFELLDYLIRNNLLYTSKNEQLLAAITKMWQDRFENLNETLKYKTIVDSRHDPKAQYRLAKMYLYGDHVEKDEELYKYWIDISSKNNYLSKIEKNINNISINYENIANEYFEKALVYYKCNQSDKNLPAAIQNLRKADYFGHPWAKIELVKLLWECNTPSSLYEYYLISSEEVNKRNHEFELFLARAYRDGKGVEKDVNLAKFYFKSAISHNIVWAYCEYFDFIWSEHMKEDYPEIIKYAEKRASEDDPHMIARLAQAYRYGLGVEIDLNKSYELMKYASEHGVSWAKEELVKMKNSEEN